MDEKRISITRCEISIEIRFPKELNPRISIENGKVFYKPGDVKECAIKMRNNSSKEYCEDYDRCLAICELTEKNNGIIKGLRNKENCVEMVINFGTIESLDEFAKFLSEKGYEN